MDNAAISVKVLKIELSKFKDNALLIGFFKERLLLSAELKRLDNELNNIISSCIKNNNFKEIYQDRVAIIFTKKIPSSTAASWEEESE